MVGYLKLIPMGCAGAPTVDGLALMEVTGKATYRTELLGDGYHRVIGWELADSTWCGLAEKIVQRAKRDGLRKLPWFWEGTKSFGWDKDEAAWFVLTGCWREIKYGSNLREVF